MSAESAGNTIKIKFPLGQITATPGALIALQESGDDIKVYLQRHCRGDWGTVDAEDAAENELSVREGFRILSQYSLLTGVRICIITERDRSLTTVLLPSEY